MEKEMELEKLQRTTKDLDTSLQEAKQDTSKMDCEALRAEVQKLKESLDEAKEQLKLSGETQARTAPPHFQPCLDKCPRPRSHSTPHDLVLYLPAVSQLS